MASAFGLSKSWIRPPYWRFYFGFILWRSDKSCKGIKKNCSLLYFPNAAWEAKAFPLLRCLLHVHSTIRSNTSRWLHAVQETVINLLRRVAVMTLAIHQFRGAFALSYDDLCPLTLLQWLHIWVITNDMMLSPCSSIVFQFPAIYHVA